MLKFRSVMIVAALLAATGCFARVGPGPRGRDERGEHQQESDRDRGDDRDQRGRGERGHDDHRD
jgi:hypothetical protein